MNIPLAALCDQSERLRARRVFDFEFARGGLGTGAGDDVDADAGDAVRNVSGRRRWSKLSEWLNPQRLAGG
jgi:hypothetical protein